MDDSYYTAREVLAMFRKNLQEMDAASISKTIRSWCKRHGWRWIKPGDTILVDKQSVDNWRKKGVAA